MSTLFARVEIAQLGQGRPRHLEIPVRVAEAAVTELRSGDAGQCAVLFRPEASGLDNAALRLADDADAVFF